MVRQRAINFSEFYDSSPRHSTRDSAAKEKESLTCSLVRSFVHSRQRERRGDPTARVDAAVLLRLRIDMHCPRLFSSCFLSPSSSSSSQLLSLSRARFPTSSTVSSVPSAFFPRLFPARSHSPTRWRFYLIALLCFIEQLLCSQTVCFFFLRSLPETAVSVISEFKCRRVAPNTSQPRRLLMVNFYGNRGKDRRGRERKINATKNIARERLCKK